MVVVGVVVVVVVVGVVVVVVVVWVMVVMVVHKINYNSWKAMCGLTFIKSVMWLW